MTAGVVVAGVALAIALYRVDRVVAHRERRREALDQQRVEADVAAKQRQLDLEERALTLKEQDARRLEVAGQPLPRLDEFPDVLRRLAESESEGWMRDDAIRIVQEEYLAAGTDWNKAAVRVFQRFRTTGAEQQVH